MASLIQIIGFVDQAGQEIVEFADGQQVSSPNPIKLGNTEYTVKAQKFGTTQPASPYVVFSGEGLFEILGTAFQLYATIESGQPIYVAEKIGNTWYGEELAEIVEQPAPSPTETPNP